MEGIYQVFKFDKTNRNTKSSKSYVSLKENKVNEVFGEPNI